MAGLARVVAVGCAAALAGLAGGGCGVPGRARPPAVVARLEAGPVRLRPGVTAVGLAVDPATGGYWMALSNGRVVAAQAPFYGSLAGKIRRGAYVAGIAADRRGYLVLTSDGGVHAFGTAWYGSDAGRLRRGVVAVGVAADAATGGYWVLLSSGRVDAFRAPRLGSLAGRVPTGGAMAAMAAGPHGGYLVMTSAGGPVPASLAGRVWNVIPTSRRVVALTFDIGPHNGVTSILATLRRDHVPGTFFLVGGTVKNFPAMARSITAAGERIGDHSNRHPHFPRVGPARMRSEVLAARAEIRRVTGLDPWPWFRFPYGDYNAQALTAVNAAGYVPIGWTVDTLGWEGTSHGITVGIVVGRVLAARRPGEIVLMHGGSDTGDHSALDARALPTVIRRLRAYGYSFVSIDALNGFGSQVRAADGRVTAFGTAGRGSDAGRLRPGVAAVGLAADPATGGYWILLSTGRVDGFDAPQLGSVAGKLPAGVTVTAIAAAPHGGYLVLTSSARVYEFRPPAIAAVVGQMVRAVTSRAGGP